MNTFKPTLCWLSDCLLIFVGDWAGGRNGMVSASAVLWPSILGHTFFSDKLALSMYRAQPVTRDQLPRAYQAVERCRLSRGFRCQNLCHCPRKPKCFCDGTKSSTASVAVTHGIFQLLYDEAVGGRLVYELGHVRNRRNV